MENSSRDSARCVPKSRLYSRALSWQWRYKPRDAVKGACGANPLFSIALIALMARSTRWFGRFGFRTSINSGSHQVRIGDDVRTINSGKASKLTTAVVPNLRASAKPTAIEFKYTAG